MTGQSLKSQTSLPKLTQFAAEFFDVSIEELTSKSRKKVLAVPRFWIFAKAKSSIDVSLRSIGDFLGGRDHSTVIHGISVYNAEMGSKHPSKLKDVFTEADKEWSIWKEKDRAWTDELGLIQVELSCGYKGETSADKSLEEAIKEIVSKKERSIHLQV